MSAPNSEPVVQVEVKEDGLVPWERALNLIKNVLVILTCVVILYVVYRAHVALSVLQENLRELGDSLGGGS